MKAKLRTNFHAARWDEPIIHELSTPGVRGIHVPPVEDSITALVGDVAAAIPAGVKRSKAPALPEVSQKHVLAHYLRLSQETHGSNIGNDISEGTCTMKYNPRINEALVALDDFSQIHPLQDEDTVQGILEVYYRAEQYIKEISGLHRVCLQPGGGSHAVYTAAAVMRAYWADKGQSDQRDEIITTIFSHPCDAATPATAGFKVITIWPKENGMPDIEALKAAVSDRTAGIFITNPEDIGIYNPLIDEFVKIIHEASGLCFYDQANANAFLGVARAREAGFDMCHFNIHKTFGTPHGCSGPGVGGFCCSEELSQFMPSPTVEFDGSKYHLNYNHPKSLGKVRDFYGAAGVVLRAFAWIISMGHDGMRACADTSVINNNYMEKKLLAIRGITSAYQNNGFIRQEQVRYSFAKMKEETGAGTIEVCNRIIDYGIPSYWMSHHPWVIPEPMTLEPCETYSKADIDEYALALQACSDEAYSNVEILKTAPHRSSSHVRNAEHELNDPDKWAVTWRAYKRKFKK